MGPEKRFKVPEAANDGSGGSLDQESSEARGGAGRRSAPPGDGEVTIDLGWYSPPTRPKTPNFFLLALSSCDRKPAGGTRGTRERTRDS